MWSKKWKSVGKLDLPESDCPPHRNQVPSEVNGGGKLTVQNVRCSGCVEENKWCKCQNGDGELKIIDQSTEADHPVKMKANSSFTHAVMNMIGMLIGLGQLSTPYALENGGWVSAFLLLGLGIVCAYSAHLLGRCLDKNPKLRSYTDIGYQAFGRKGKIIAAAFIYVEIFMALVSYTISLHDNLNRVFIGTKLSMSLLGLAKPQLLTVVAVLVALPSLWLRDLSSISFLSIGGILMSMLIFVTVASSAICGVKATHNIPILQIQKIPHISGLYIFSYTGHIVFPNIHKAMKDPSKFTKVAIVSFTTVTALYTALAFMGAKLYGPAVNSQITLSMPPHLLVTKLALWATVLTPMTKYALEFAPFAIQLEHSLPPSMGSRTKTLIRGSVGSILLLFVLALALTVPYFQHVLGLTGSLVSVTICMILPCTFYIKIFRREVSKSLLILNLGLIILGYLLGVVGTVSSSKALIKALKAAAHNT
ncbi:Amino acid transporter avt1h [Dionaea muscipula]